MGARQWHTSEAEMKPLPSLSKTLKASRSSSSWSVSYNGKDASLHAHGRQSVSLASDVAKDMQQSSMFLNIRCLSPPLNQLLTFILRAMRFRNSGKSMVPLPSASTSLIMSCSSASVGFCPKLRMTVPSSFVVMVPKSSKHRSLRFSTDSHVFAADKASGALLGTTRHVSAVITRGRYRGNR